jgi:hypothetical protein
MNSNLGVDSLGVTDGLTEDERSLLTRIPADGTYIGIQKTRRDLNWDDDRIWQVLEGLAQKNIIKTGPGYGGTVRRFPASTPQVVLETDTAPQAATEGDLYAPLENVLRDRWARTMKLEDPIVQTTAKQGRRDTGTAHGLDRI